MSLKMRSLQSDGCRKTRFAFQTWGFPDGTQSWEKDSSNNFTLTDFSSLNCTFVNNKKVSKTVVSRGDTITIGKYTIIFEPDDKSGHDEKSATAEALIKGPSTEVPAENEIKEVTAKEQTSISPEQPKDGATAAGAVSSVLIETNKHVVYKLDKPFITLGASENDDIFVSGFMVGEGSFSTLPLQDIRKYSPILRIEAK